MTQRRCAGCMAVITEDICPHCGCSAREANTPNQLPIGTVLQGQYQVGRVLGHGGFGITYIGWDTYLDMVVAIKEFYPSSAVNRDVTQSLSVRVNAQEQAEHYEASRERFLREAKTLAKLQNVPEIVHIQNFFTENNTAYIIMEYVRGIDLRHYVQQKGGKLQPGELLKLLEPVVRALDTVHRSGLVHRDISPDNIMIQPSGRTKLLDFGAARDVENADADVDLARSTEAILKHGFAPMEQYRSRGNLGPWTDEYGFCASVYYCLTGKLPPDAPARAMGDAQPDWDSIPELTEGQRAALEKGMAMRAKDRFGSMEALRKALYENAPVPGANAPKEPEKQPEAPKKKKKRWAPVAACLLLLAGAAAAAAWYFAPEITLKAPAQTQPALTEPAVTETAPAETDLGLAEVFPTETQQEVSVITVSEPWAANVMQRKPLSALGIDKLGSVNTVIFLDTLADMPANAVDVSTKKDGSVMGWTKWSNGYHVTFAAEGGINGRESCEGLFQGCPNLQSVSFGNAFHTDQAVSMRSMFAYCCRLRSVDLEALETGNVQNMEYMFSIRDPDARGFYSSTWQNEDFSLTEMDLSGWDMKSVTDTSYMFYGRHNLGYLTIGKWNLSSLTDMSYMFAKCSSLQTLDVSSWDLSNVTNMGYAFHQCNKLQTLDVGRWDVSNVTNMSYAFYYCNALKSLDVRSWDVSSVSNMSNMFAYCSNLQTLDVTNWNVSNVTNMSYMFSACSRLKNLVLDNWNVSKVSRYEGFMDSGTIINNKYWMAFFED